MARTREGSLRYYRKHSIDPEWRNRRNAKRRIDYAKTKKNNPKYSEYNKAAQKKCRNKLRDAVLDGYGAQCVCCGETIREFLTIDHVNGGGGKHRRSRAYHLILRDIIEQGFPSEYRILCMNCNWGRRFYEECPHKWAVASK